VSTGSSPDPDRRSSTWPVRAVVILFGLVVLALLLWQIREALLIAFAAVLMATFFSGAASHVRGWIGVSRGWALAIVIVSFVLLLGGCGALIGQQAAQEFGEMVDQLPQAAEQFQEMLPQLGGEEEAEGEEDDEEPEGLVTGLIGVAFHAADILGTLVLILVVGIFFAVKPDLYKNGIALLVPQGRADRVREALDTSGRALWKWLLGMSMASLFAAVLTTIGLLIVGAPLPIALGILAGVLNFVPFVGPIVAAIPAVLIALAQDPQLAVWVVVVYIVVQQVEGNLILPLVQRKAAHLPPALMLLSIVAFSLLFGIGGVILAVPLAVVTMVFVGILYVEDVLGKEVEVPGRE
jgi:predicted PurR-regulated permease PerM